MRERGERLRRPKLSEKVIAQLELSKDVVYANSGGMFLEARISREGPKPSTAPRIPVLSTGHSYDHFMGGRSQVEKPYNRLRLLTRLSIL